MRSLIGLATSLVLYVISISPAFGQAPDLLSFQGYLTDSTETAIDAPSVSITFKLYKDGSAVWTESHPNVKVAKGVFNVLLGGTTSLRTMAFDAPLELGITVGGDPEISPRSTVAGAAYAKALPGLYTFYRDAGTIKGYNVVGGGPDNVVGAAVQGATIGGGGGFDRGDTPNSVLDNFATVSGGYSNTASGFGSAIGGGTTNSASGITAIVGGGNGNQAGDDYSTVGGGDRNKALGSATTIAGGYKNEASTGGATVGGGNANVADGATATVGGGQSNLAFGQGTTIGGGSGNTTVNSWATVPGGNNNSARGVTSFAAGWHAKAIHDGTFVWNDRSVTSLNDSLVSTGANQFLIRAVGGVGIGTNSPDSGSLLDVAGAIHTGGAATATMLYRGTNSSGSPNGDGIRLRYDAAFNGPTADYFIIEKTDSGSSPDGGIAFVNTGSDGIVETALTIRGSGRVGIGTASPVADLHIAANSNSSTPHVLLQEEENGGFARLRLKNDSNSEYWDVAAGNTTNERLNFYTTQGRGDVMSLRATGTPLVMYNGATLTHAGEWTNVSSVSRKTDFIEIDPRTVLEGLAALPVRQWRYKVESETVIHIGPTAEDFHEMFGLGESTETIGTGDAGGVALAAIQGLYELVREQQAEIERLRQIVERQ